MAEPEGEYTEKPSQGNAAAFTGPEQADYGGIALAEWKQALRKDVEERFEPTPDDLKPVGKPGW